ncbi:hypothetical protein G6F57_018485 [Rhizopus arrhizus]|nr:hypothetical protein G6F57_018485 [Rhizopus arrhizus]
MTLNPRQSALIEMVRAQGSASIEELAKRFDVTLQTVRRDVNILSEAGLLSRFHGGVRIEASTIENIAYRKRQGLHAAGKQRIAEAVARAAGRPWDGLADDLLFKPLGMTATSYRFSDFMARDNRAVLHGYQKGVFVPLGQRDADQQAPAGGAIKASR